MAEVDVRPGENSAFAEKESRSLVPTLKSLCPITLYRSHEVLGDHAAEKGSIDDFLEHYQTLMFALLLLFVRFGYLF
jgi:hypothetical protein